MDGKPNLVLLNAMADPAVGGELRALFVKKNKTREDLDAALVLIGRTNAITRAKEIAKEYTTKAEVALSHLPDSEHRRSMKLLAETLVERNT